jgi:hypothetical protein
MATGRRRTRILTVGDRQFLWRCDLSHPAEVHSVGYAERGASWPPDRLIVRPEDGPHRCLTVTWSACYAPTLRPALVRVCVEEALRRGWLTELGELNLSGADLPGAS